MARRLLQLVALAASAAAFAGCDSAEGQRAQQLLLDADAAHAGLTSAAYEGRMSFEVAGQKAALTFDGGVQRPNGFMRMRFTGMPGAEMDMSVVLRAGTAWMGMNGTWQRLPLASLGAAGDPALGPAAFAELTKHVKSVRVTEDAVVAGRAATIVAGEVDTEGLLGAASKLSGLSSQLGTADAARGLGDLDLGELGVEVGDVHAVLTFDDESKLLTAALVKVAVQIPNDELELQLNYRLTSWNQPVEIPNPAP